MAYDWILYVLDDLRGFAEVNGLTALAEQLDDARLLAATEISQRADPAPGRWAEGHAKKAGAVYRSVGGHDNA